MSFTPVVMGVQPSAEARSTLPPPKSWTLASMTGENTLLPGNQFFSAMTSFIQLSIISVKAKLKEPLPKFL
jgi:hypothetical protein